MRLQQEKVTGLPEAFLDRATDSSPSLRVKYSQTDTRAKVIRVGHLFGGRPGAKSRDCLKSLAEHPALRQFIEFYKRHDGVQICRTFDSRYDEVRPLLELKPIDGIAEFSDRYSPAGDRAGEIDLNKSKTIYRGSSRWLAFAEINSGPACLTIFLDGANAGSVFFVTPQPSFNILRPVAKDFNSLLYRVGADVAAFLRLVRATVVIRRADGSNYGFVPIEYRTGRGRPKAAYLNCR